MQVVVDGLLTNYQAAGKGKTVLLLHGWGDNLLTFKALQKSLSQNYQTIALDLPGFGNTDAPKQVWSLDDYSKFVDNFLSKIKAGQIHVIVGHSNGGALAIRGISVGILKPDKLILLASSGVRDKQKGKKLAIKAVAKVGKATTFWLPDHHKKKLQKKLYGAVGSDMLVAPHIQETFKKTVAQDIQADATNIQVPTLLIYARNDKAVPLEYGQILADLIKGSKLEVIDDAEHFVHHDQPQAVERLIKGFIK